MKSPRLLSWFREEVFSEFALGPLEFEAFEPFGDNSRHRVGPKKAGWHPEIGAVVAAFR